MKLKWVCPHCGMERNIRAVRAAVVMHDLIPTPVCCETLELDLPEIRSYCTARYECAWCHYVLPISPPDKHDDDECLIEYLKSLPYNKEE